MSNYRTLWVSVQRGPRRTGQPQIGALLSAAFTDIAPRLSVFDDDSFESSGNGHARPHLIAPPSPRRPATVLPPRFILEARDPRPSIAARASARARQCSLCDAGGARFSRSETNRRRRV